MKFTTAELVLSLLLAAGIGGLIGIERGVDLSCEKAKTLAKSHRTGEILVQVPAPIKVDGAVWGSGWLANKLCEGR
jgi:hypothetical protein